MRGAGKKPRTCEFRTRREILILKSSFCDGIIGAQLHFFLCRETIMKQKKDNKQILQDFRVCLNLQYLAISITLFLLILLVLLYRRPDIFGDFSKNAIVLTQILLVGAFVAFSAHNWRCPSCKKYLGSNIHRTACRHCGARLRK